MHHSLKRICNFPPFRTSLEYIMTTPDECASNIPRKNNQVSYDDFKSAVQYMKHLIYHFTKIISLLAIQNFICLSHIACSEIAKGKNLRILI